MTMTIPMTNAVHPLGTIENIPGTPPTPIEVASTFWYVINAAAIAEPIMAAINGYLNRKLTPNIAGSVIPSHAEIPDVPERPRSFSSFVASIIANAADPWAIFDKASIGHKNVHSSTAD